MNPVPCAVPINLIISDSLQDKAKAGLKAIWMAETKANAEKALDAFQPG